MDSFMSFVYIMNNKFGNLYSFSTLNKIEFLYLKDFYFSYMISFQLVWTFVEFCMYVHYIKCIVVSIV